MKKKLCLFLFFCPFFCKALSLTDTIKYGLDYSIQLKISNAKKEKAEAILGEAYSSYWPQVSLVGKSKDEVKFAGSNYYRGDDESAMLTVATQYTLIDLARGEKVKAAKYNQDEEEWDRRAKIEKAKFDITKSYLDIWKKKNEENVLESDYSSLSSLVNKVHARVDAGMSQESDMLRAKVAADETRNKLDNVRKELGNAEIQLSSLTGLALSKNDVYDVSNINITNIKITKRDIIKYSPALKVLSTRVEQKRIEYNAIKKDDYPKVNAIANYKEHFRNVVSPDMQFFVQVSMPLFNGFNSTNKRKAAISELEINKLTLSMAEKDLVKNYETLLNSFDRERKAWEMLKTNAVNSKKVKEQFYNEFPLGIKGIEDLITAERSETDAELRLIDSQYNIYLYYLAIFHLNGNTDEAILNIGSSNVS
ncbi:TolC family protein [Erwinia sp. HDF1-3R]|uniref:TolC family protein n=1 Tax=Erwinia sp. HDF1-3R TaxID=3141543 RepID=UPI0031F59D98